jgi:hypothetical protein
MLFHCLISNKTAIRGYVKNRSAALLFGWNAAERIILLHSLSFSFNVTFSGSRGQRPECLRDRKVLPERNAACLHYP